MEDNTKLDPKDIRAPGGSYSEPSSPTTLRKKSASPSRRRRSSSIKRSESVLETNVTPKYSLGVTYVNPNNGKAERLSSINIVATPCIDKKRAAYTPAARRNRTWSATDIRESEGETIPLKSDSRSRWKKKKRKAKKRAEKAKRKYEPVEIMPPAEEGEQEALDVEGESGVEVEQEQVSVEGPEAIAEIEYPSEQVEEEYTCLVARTALVMPFHWGLKNVKSGIEFAGQLAQRRFTDSHRRLIPMWMYKERLPTEVGDFTPQFRQVIGWKDRDRPITPQTWTCLRLMLNPELIPVLFSHAKLFTIQGDKQVVYNADWEAVELLIYPMGSAILVIHVNWIPNRADTIETKLTLDDIRTLIFASKYRQKVNQLSLGWNFFYHPSHQAFPSELNLPDDHIRNYGIDMFEARYQPDKTVSLSVIGNWLLHSIHEDPSSPTLLLDFARHASHHSTIVINKEPPAEVLQEYLFHLRRAFGQTNRPPPNPEYHLGSVLAPRRNRYIGISREGSVCMSWPTNVDDPFDFELTRWHRKFQGVYLVLALHVYGERSVLFSLSDLAAAQAEHLVSDERNLEDMKMQRERLRELASLMVRYTLAMSSNDCGGSSEYTEFFTTIRQVYGIPELRAEISTELKDVLAVVESNYMEEERRQRDVIESERRRSREIANAIRMHRDRNDQRFGILLSIMGAFTIPFVVISGIFGMNLTSLPISVDFWTLMGITFAASVVLFLALILWRMYSQKMEARRDPFQLTGYPQYQHFRP